MADGGKVMFNPHAPSTEHSTRSLVFRQSLAAAFKSHRLTSPPLPPTLAVLLDICRNGMAGIVSSPGCHDALTEIRSRIFRMPGRDVEAQTLWHDALATAVFSARIAQLTNASIPSSFLAALLHRSGEAMALKILARVELDYRLKLDSTSRREWCNTHSQELTERLVRAWNLTPDVGSCVVGWRRFGEFSEVSGEASSLYFGRLFAIEFLQPDLCVPGALDHAAAERGLESGLITQVRGEGARVRELVRVTE
jgi:hypothetical protein